MNLEPGSRIGDYDIVSQLGAGGMGRVYKVRNELSDRLEAMKVLLPDLEGQADLANRFLREIKVQAGLDHPNIAKLYSASRIDNRLLMFMELVEGITVDERLKQGLIPIGNAVDYIAQVLSALDYAHQRGVVHRDIKPANMMLLPGGTVKLLDFGIAKAAADQRLTMTGTTLGSLYYMSPEQIQGSHVDMRSDLYSVGVSLYEMVTGKKPFDGESQFAIMSAHLARPPVPPVEMNALLPQAISEIILMALNKDPASRFQTASAFLSALRAVRTDEAAGTVSPAVTAPLTESPTAFQATPLPPPRPIVTPSVLTGTTMTAPVVTPSGNRPPTTFRDSVAGVTAARLPQPQQPAAAPLPPAPFRGVEPTDIAVKKPGPKRLIWVVAGGLCAALAIVAFIQFGPRMKTSAKETPLNERTISAPPASSLDSQLPAPPPAAAPDNKLPADQAAALFTPVKPASAPDGRKSKVERAQVQPDQSRTPQAQVQNPQAKTPPQAAQPQPPPPQPGQPQKSQYDSQMPALANQNRMNLQQLRDGLDQLYARAGAIRDLLSQMQRSQASQGVGMRSDWVESFNLTNTFLKRANEALNAADENAAKSAMEKADHQLGLLEKALGK